jgi:hypothetical protein
VWLLQPWPAFALPLEAFECLTGNSVFDCSIGETQLAGHVEANTGEEAVLVILNSGEDQAVVARIYVESELVTAIRGPHSATISFASGGAPPVLPGAGRTFEVNARASALPPGPKTGIGPGEVGLFTLTLLEGTAFADLVADMRVGVHVIAFESGGSESFVTQPIPEPSTGTLILLAAGMLVSFKKIRRSGRGPS